MTPPIWPREDDIGQKRNQKTIEIESAFQRRDSNEGATTGTATIDDESAQDDNESISTGSKQSRDNEMGSNSKDKSIKAWAKSVSAAAAAIAMEDQISENCGENLGCYRDAAEKRHYEWLATHEGRAFSKRLAAAADRDTTSVLGYVHWTFPDQSVEDQYPSYIMARSLDDVIIGYAKSSSSSSPIQVQVSFLSVDIFEGIKIYLPHVECLLDPFCFVV